MTMNIIHSKCGDTVYSDLNKCVRLLGTFGLGNKATKLGQAYIDVTKSGQQTISYYCAACKKEVPFEEIQGICSYCGKPIPVKDLFRQIGEDGKPTGDISCKPCLEKYEVKYSDLVPLVDILSKIYIQS